MTVLFRLFLDMGHFYREHGYLDCSHSRVRRTEIVQEFAEIVDPERRDIYREALIFDLYKIEKSKSRPFWAKECAAGQTADRKISAGTWYGEKILPF